MDENGEEMVTSITMTLVNCRDRTIATPKRSEIIGTARRAHRRDTNGNYGGL